MSRNEICEVSASKGINILSRSYGETTSGETEYSYQFNHRKEMRQKVGVCKQGSPVYASHPGFPLKKKLFFMLVMHNGQKK